ncbi:MAG: hypothetical protein EOO14_10230 [Chitinophagaceae bacterium]|nr:MAG: hypothetical protein EOO14_10230 [Chitinophagaceae bacterium]
MRKWIIWLLGSIVIILVVIYLVIPITVVFKEQTHIPLPGKAFSRAFLNPATWTKWWPESTIGDTLSPSQFTYKENIYTIQARKHSSYVISISNGRDSALTELLLVPAKPDSATLNWLGVANTSANPFKRLQKGRWANGVKDDISKLLQHLETHYTKAESLYNFPIREIGVVDSNLISTFAHLPQSPTTEDIYQLLNSLQSFAKNKGAVPTGNPMLNITKQDSHFLTRVALPIDKSVSPEGNIEYRRMPGGGNILVTEVKGGPHTIEKAFAEMSNWIQDHHRQSPAIPYQSLVTDRRNEPDSNNWVTKIYWPVM